MVVHNLPKPGSENCDIICEHSIAAVRNLPKVEVWVRLPLLACEAVAISTTWQG